MTMALWIRHKEGSKVHKTPLAEASKTSLFEWEK